MYQSDIQIRVRYAETDQMGYVYHGNYAAYFEVARTESFRELGIRYKDLEAQGVGSPPAEFGRFMESESARLGTLIRAAGIRLS